MNHSHAVHVLDVAHGNAALCLGESFALLVDAARGGEPLLSAIEHLRVTRLDIVVISHRDMDHAGGLPALLTDVNLEIGVVYISADATKRPGGRQALLLGALEDARRARRCVVSRDLDAAMPAHALDGGGLAVEVLAPTFTTAMTGAGGEDSRGRTLSSNSTSAVVRVTLDSGLRVLLTGDIDDTTMNELEAAEADLTADVLVFPHHGSHSAVADQRGFAARVAGAVSPKFVAFSVGRGAIPRPNAEIVAGVLDAIPRVHIACTQLSSACATDDNELPTDPEQLQHLSDVPAAGRERCRSCAGSLAFSGSGMNMPSAEAHREYLTMVGDNPLCMALRAVDAPPASEASRVIS